MKKLWTEVRARRRNRDHAKASLIERLKWKAWRRTERQRREGLQPARAQSVKRHHTPVTFAAAGVLSLIEAPDLASKFFHYLQKFNKRRDVFVDLANVTRITPDAIALLLSIVIKLGRAHNIRISGNYPNVLSASDTIRESGFDQYLKSSLPPSKKSQGAIVKRDLVLDARQAESYHAQKLVDFAAKDDNDILRLKVAYGHLLECMANTHEHAGHSTGTESWWASVFKDEERKRDCFTFIDMGVGIFDSIELNIRLKLLNLVGTFRPIILRKLLQGQIPSSTKKSYRGRGLPSIYDSLVTGKTISRFMIITNDVYADVEQDRFIQLPHGLKGLLLYWEVPYERH